MKNNFFQLRNIDGILELMLDNKTATADLFQSMQVITDLLSHKGIISIDFSDISSLLQMNKMAFVVTGFAKGKNRVHKAMTNSLFDEIELKKICGFFVSVSATADMTMNEFEEARNFIGALPLENPMIRIGFSIDEDLGDFVKITMIVI